MAAGNGAEALAALRGEGCVVVEKALDREWLVRYAQAAWRFHEILSQLDPSQIPQDST